MLRRYREAYKESRQEIQAQATQQEQRLQSEAEEQREEVGKQAEEAKLTVRGSLSEMEREHTKLSQKLREAERKEQYKRGLPSHIRVSLDTEAKLKDLEAQASVIFTKSQKSLVEIDQKKADALLNIKEALARAMAGVKEQVEGAIREAKEHYEGLSGVFEAEHIKLGDGQWIDKKEWEAFFADIPQNIKEKFQAIAKTEGLDAMNKAIEETPITAPIDNSLRDFVDIKTGELKLTEAVSSGITNVEIYNQSGYKVSQSEIDDIVAESKKNIQISEDRWVEKAVWDALNDTQRQEVIDTGSYTIGEERALTGAEALQLLKDDPTKDVPQDATLESYNSQTGQVVYTSPSISEDITLVTSDGEEKTINRSEWEGMSALDRLAFTLGRQPTAAEYLGLRAYEEGIEPSVWETMPVVGQVVTGLEFVTGATIPMYNPETGKMEQVPPTGVQYFKLKQEALADYYSRYPEAIGREAIVLGFEELGFPAAKALLPQIKAKEVTGEEWLQTGLTTALVGALGVGGRIARTVFPVIGTGATYLTVKHWDELPTDARVAAVLTNTLFFLPVLIPMARSVLQLPKTLKITTAYEKATYYAQRANKLIAKLMKTPVDDVKFVPLRDKAFVAVSKAQSTNNTLNKVLQASTKNKTAQGIQNKAVIDAALNAKKAFNEMTTAVNKLAKEKGALADPKIANRVQQTTQASKLADQAFLDKFAMLEKIDIEALSLLEKQSGYTGLTDAVRRVIKAQASLKEAWLRLDLLYKTKPYTQAMLRKAISDIQVAKTELTNALDNWGNVAKIRVTPKVYTGYDGLIQAVEKRIVELKKSMSINEGNQSWALTPSKLKALKEDWLDMRSGLTKAEADLANLIKRRDAGLPPPEIEGYGIRFVREVKEPDIPMTPEQQARLGRLQELSRLSREKYETAVTKDLAEARALKKPAVAVAEMERPQMVVGEQATFRLELEPAIREMPTIAEPTVKIPAIVEPTPIVEVAPVPKPVVTPKVAVEVAPTPKPITTPEAVGEVVPTTILTLEDLVPSEVEVVPAVVVTPAVIEEAIVEAVGQPFRVLTPDVQTRMITITQEAVEYANRLKPVDMTAMEFEIKVNEFILNKLGVITEPVMKAEIKPFTQPMTKTVMKIAVKTGVLTTVKPVGRIITPPPPPFVATKSEEKWDKRKPIPEPYVTMRMGAPRGFPQGMWKLLPPPYNKVYHIHGIPKGATKDAVGEGSAYATIQVVGDAPLPKGFVRIEKKIGAVKFVIFKDKTGKLAVDFKQTLKAFKGEEPMEVEVEATKKVPYEGRSYEATLQANTKEQLEIDIAKMSEASKVRGYEDITVLSIHPNPKGVGYEAEILAHNFNPFAWVKEQAGKITTKIKGLYRRHEPAVASVKAEKVVQKEVGEAQVAKETAVEEIKEEQTAEAISEAERYEAIEAVGTAGEEEERLEAEHAKALHEAEEKEANQAVEFARQQEAEAMEASKAKATEEAKVEPVLLLAEPEKRRRRVLISEDDKQKAEAFRVMHIEDRQAFRETYERRLEEATQIASEQSQVASGLKASVEEKSRLNKLLPIWDRIQRRKDQPTDITVKEYKEITGKEYPKMTKTDKFGRTYVSWEHALDEVVTEYGYDTPEELYEAVETHSGEVDQLADAKLLSRQAEASAKELERSLKILDVVEASPEEKTKYELYEPEPTVEPTPITERPEPPHREREEIGEGILGEVGEGRAGILGEPEPRPEPELEPPPSLIELGLEPEPKVEPEVKIEPKVAVPTSEEIEESIRAFKAKKGISPTERVVEVSKPVSISEEEWKKMLGEKGTKVELEELKKWVATNPALLEANPELKKVLEEAESKDKEEEKEAKKTGKPRLKEPVLVHLQPKAKKKVGILAPIDLLPTEEAVEVKSVRLGKELMPQYHNGLVEVYLVNGDFVESRYGVSLNGGASDALIPNIIPQNEIWVSRNPNKDVVIRSVLAQIITRRLIKEGVDPEKAKEKGQKEASGYMGMTGMMESAIKEEFKSHPETAPPVLIERDGLEPAIITKEGARDRRQRLTKPKGEKEWWEDSYYDEEKPHTPKRKVREVEEPERTYLGHKLLPPNLGHHI